MSEILEYKIIDGIKCYSPDVAIDFSNYPNDGFVLTDENVESSFWVSSRNKLFKNIIESNLVVNGRTKFLEIGCGTGNFIEQIAENKKIEITGSEIYTEGLHYAKKRIHNVEFIQLDVAQGRLKEDFDLIASFDVLEHVDEDVRAIANIHSMLKKDGKFIISVPQHMFLWGRLDELVMHKRRYSRRELVGKLESANFKVEFITSYVFVLFPLMLLSRFFDRGGHGSGTDKTDLEKRVKFPRVINLIFSCMMFIDEYLIRLGISLPFGGTLVAVAKKC